VLITNNHVLEEKNIAEGTTINFTLNKKSINKEIFIDKSRKTYTNKSYDITIIEIREEDGLKEDQFLEIEPKIYEEDYKKEFQKKDVYIIGNICFYTTGKIWYISDDYVIQHKCSTQPGMSGSPIINLRNYKVIGVHKGADPKEFNLGVFIREPIKEFNVKFPNLKDNQNEKPNTFLFDKNEENREISKKINQKIIKEKNEEMKHPGPHGDTALKENPGNNQGNALRKKSSFVINFAPHPHELIYKPLEESFRADCLICQKSIQNGGAVFLCKECPLILCYECGDSIIFGDKIKKMHQHALNLIFRMCGWKCDICSKHFMNALSFYCQPCDHDICPKCFLSD
jgi:hypothetical protein